MSFHSLPLVINEVRATEAVLNRIYDAAKLGLKGDNLALAAGMVPTAYRQLCELDRAAQLAEQKGRADGELLASKQLHKAAEEGDAKASLAILQNVHGWVAKQAISVDVNQQISILGALAEAERRVIDMGTIDEAPTNGNSTGLLINNRKEDGDDSSNSNAGTPALSARLRPQHRAIPVEKSN